MIRGVKYGLLLIFLHFSIHHSIAQVSFCAVGDVLLDRGVRKVIDENSITYPFEKIKSCISQNDLAFFNLECPVAGSTDGYPMNKRYSFRAEPEYIEGIKYAGFTIASVANNHTIDYGKSGFLKTIELLNTDSIFTVGGGKNQQEAFKPLLIEKNGETFAFFGMLEFLLEGTTFNENKPYPAFGQIDRLCKIIQEYNDIIDNIIVSFHWGKENDIYPTSRQTEYAHKVIDAGADLVLGHHPHVIQGIETYRNKLILYSLGNFVFDHSEELQKQSVIFQCKFKDGNILRPELIPVYIKNNRPEPATKQIAMEIFEHLTEISDTLNTGFSFHEEVIQINYEVENPIKETQFNELVFHVFKNRISVYDDQGYHCSYDLPDTNYTIKDACVYSEDSTVFFYTIVCNKSTNKSRIGIFPYSPGKREFLKPSLDSHDDYHPWKIELCDVDKDDNPEIILGVNKSTRYSDNKENRIFVFNREKNYIFPKWLGSKLGNPIVDFKVDKHTSQLILLEESKESSIKKAVSYIWNGFGFDYDKILFDIENLNNLEIQFQLSDYNFKTIL